jgi:hypothetical protein
MNKFKFPRMVIGLLSLLVIAVAALFIIPSANPAQCSPDNSLCALLKEKITKPRNAQEKNKRSYYCGQMKRRSCSEYKTVCENASSSPSTPDLRGEWVSSDWGEIIIMGSEPSYTGTYTGPNYVKGVEGNFAFAKKNGAGTYKGTWNDPDGKHKGTLDKIEFSSDGFTLNVTWSATDGRRGVKSTWSRKTP